jgi:hypothetical protein
MPACTQRMQQSQAVLLSRNTLRACFYLLKYTKNEAGLIELRKREIERQAQEAQEWREFDKKNNGYSWETYHATS